MVSDRTSTTPEAYLAALEPDRREIIGAVREIILANLPEGYEETMAWGMITYQVPLATYPDTYNGQPLAFVSIAAQKRHNAVYMMGLYSDSDEDRSFREQWAPPSGKKLDMGKSCVRFTKLDDADLDLMGATIAAMPVDRFIATYQRAQQR